MRAQNAAFGREREKRQILSAIRKRLFHFKYLDAPNACLVVVFLGACQFAAMTASTIFIVYQKSKFRLLPVTVLHSALQSCCHPIRIRRELCTPGREGFSAGSRDRLSPGFPSELVG